MTESGLIHSLWLGARRLRRSPGFALLATLCLALALGSVITIFAVINGLFLKPLPGLEDPGDLVTLHFEGPTSVPNLVDLRAGANALAGIGAFRAELAAVRVGDGAEMAGRSERVLAAAVTAEYFGVLRTETKLGRFFSVQEDGPPGAYPVAVISHDYWQRRMDADLQVLGREVRVNGTPLSVVGVAPPGFLGTFTGFPVDVWVPLSMASVVSPGFDASDRAGGGLEFIARLAAGATLDSARTEMAASAARLEAAHPMVNRDFRIEVHDHTGFDEEIRTPAMGLVALLLAIAVLVLVIGSLNFTNMLLARSAERTKEAAIRRALGVERRDLIASFLTENLLLALLGAGGGLLMAQWLSDSFTGFLRILPIRIHLELGLDWRVVGASIGLAVIVAVATGLVPALRISGRDLASALKDTPAVGPSGRRFARCLLGAQLAGSTALLVIAGLFVQTVARVASVDPGFRMEDLRVVPFLDASLLGLEGAELSDFFERMVDEANAVPGVAGAAVGSSVPLAFGGLSATRIEISGREPAEGQDGFETTMAVISPEYADTMGIALLEGRPLRPDDGPERPAVAVVSEAMAERFWPGENAVGRRFRNGLAEIEIVGVLANVAVALDGTPGVTFYVPHAQRPRDGMNLFVRLQPGASSAAPGVAAALRRLDPDLPAAEPQPVSDFLLLSLLPQRVAGAVGSGLGVTGLLLAALGVYGLVAFSVAQRGREIGIRMAVGAKRRDVLSLVFRDTLRLAAWGVGFGLAIAIAAGQLIESLLIGVSPAEPLPLAVAALAVVLFAVLATLAPARRAASVDPVRTLAAE